jgi:hypothetical protein
MATPFTPKFNYPNNKLYQYEAYPVLVNCNFIVDVTNGNGLGIRSLKGAGVANVFMHTNSAISPNLGLARSYATLSGSSITNTGSSVLTGNLGVSPGSTLTGFPPGVVVGSVNLGNAAAATAQANALTAYNFMHAEVATPISPTLDGQVLTPGVYSESSGTFNLAASGNGTLTLNGAGIYIFKAASTLVTGAGGIPTILLTNGATANNVFWLVGSSATINSGSAGVFQGSILAVTSITDTLGGTVNGSLIALNGSVTLSAASIVNAQSAPASQPGMGNHGVLNPNPAPGYILVQFDNQFNRLLQVFGGQISPVSGSPLTSVSVNQVYVIVSLGTSTPAQWYAVGFPPNMMPSVGAAFVATSSGTIGGSAAVEVPGETGIGSIEAIGDPNQTLASSNVYQYGGAQILLQALSPTSSSVTTPVPTQPAQNSVISLSFLFSNSSIAINGQ